MVGVGMDETVVVQTQETLGHITSEHVASQTPLPVTYRGSRDEDMEDPAADESLASAQRIQPSVDHSMRAMQGLAPTPAKVASPIARSPGAECIQADIVVEAVGGNVFKSPQTSAAEARGGMGLLTPRGINASFMRSMDESVGPSLHDSEPLFPHKLNSDSTGTEELRSIKGGSDYRTPAQQTGVVVASDSTQEGYGSGGRAGDANNKATPTRNAMAYAITPSGLPVLHHNAPNDGPLDTPRPPNYDDFVQRYDEFDRAGPNPHGRMGGSPHRGAARSASREGSFEEDFATRTSSHVSLAQRGKISSDISKRTLKSGGRSNTISRIRSFSNYDMDPETTEPENKIVTIDCGGKIFRTFLRTLWKHPGTLLYDLAQPGGELHDDGAIFIDRDYRCYSAILNYYRTSVLEQPSNITDEQWNMELLFFKIENPLFKFPTAAEVEIAQLERGRPKEPGFRRTIWLLWEDPSSSLGAKFIMSFSVVLSIVGVIAFVLETDPTFKDDEDESYRFLGFTSSDVRWGLKAFEISVVMYFTFEFFVRFFANEKKKEFLRRPMTWTDLVAVCPFYIGMMLDPAVIKGSSSIFVRMLTLARVLRVVGLVFKLGKYSHGVRVLAHTFKTCVMELSILGVLLIIAVVMISSGMYFCEYDDPIVGGENTEFVSISRSMYFSMISVTTIGYGDMTPKTSCGEFVACMAGLSGIFVLGLPISIIGVKFQERYDEMLREVKINNERDRLTKIDAKLQSMKGMKVLANKILGPRDPQAGDLTAQELDTVQRRCLDVFKEVDTDESGEIDLEELGAGMKQLGMEIERDVLEVMMQAMDDDGSQTVDQGEFLDFVLKCITGDIRTLSENAERRTPSSPRGAPAV